MMTPRWLWLAVLAAFCALPARAQTPEEIVRWIYVSQTLPGAAKGYAHLSAPGQREQFLSRRMIAFHAANDSHGGDVASACVDFAFDIPGNDFDAQEIARTLSVTAEGDAGRRVVTARFSNFGTPAQIAYDFVPEDGFWRIDDIAGPGFRVSRIPCAPKAAAAPGVVAAGGYCFKSGRDTFRLQIAADGSAWFDLESWQGGGHFCGARGVAQPQVGGWLYQEDLWGRLCRMQIMVTDDQGIRLADPDHGCKMTLCGQRAAIDGLSFPRQAQVDCATLPPPQPG
ncbi:MAG: hypothetical protein KDK29_08605 [Sedimentitalea sp.]|nr:hypothetical protein [Sedimentitalea sp.]